MKKNKDADTFEDNELVYLFKYETCMKAKDILYEKYKHKLFVASVHFIKLWIRILPIEISDLVSLNYSNFIYALQTYDVNNRKYDFASSLFTINRSNLSLMLNNFINRNKDKLMANCIELTEDVEQSSTYQKAITSDKDIRKIEDRVNYEHLLQTIKSLISGESLMIRLTYMMFVYGILPVQIAKILNIKLAQVYFIIKKINSIVQDKHKIT